MLVWGKAWQMKLIIQIPCYNEAKTLAVTLDDLPKRIDGIDEIQTLIIDDGSKDDTAGAARAWGVDHIVRFKANKGLAYGFMAGIDACLKLGADIIVNTDADNQYRGEDIAQLVKPILDGKADMVIGERPIENTEHFSPTKKRMQRLGSHVVRLASGTSVPDAPSGFRAYSRDCAMQLNVTNVYTYTLETIIQAGAKKMTIANVPIHTNPELRKSRLFSSMWQYIRRAAVTIIRSNLMYRPLKFFVIIGMVLFALGFLLGVRFLVYYFQGQGGGHIQSLILTAILILLGFQCVVSGLMSDIIAANRKLIEDVQYRVRKIYYDGNEHEQD